MHLAAGHQLVVQLALRHGPTVLVDAGEVFRVFDLLLGEKASPVLGLDLVAEQALAVGPLLPLQANTIAPLLEDLATGKNCPNMPWCYAPVDPGNGATKLCPTIASGLESLPGVLDALSAWSFRAWSAVSRRF